MSGCGLFGSDDDPPEPIDPSEWRGDWNVDTFGEEPKSELYYSITSNEIEIFAGEECPDEVAVIDNVDRNTISGTFQEEGEKFAIRIEDTSTESLTFTIVESPSQSEEGTEVSATLMEESIRDVAASCNSGSSTQQQSVGTSFGD